jgi:hypothetical protein
MNSPAQTQLAFEYTDVLLSITPDTSCTPTNMQPTKLLNINYDK